MLLAWCNNCREVSKQQKSAKFKEVFWIGSYMYENLSFVCWLLFFLSYLIFFPFYSFVLFFLSVFISFHSYISRIAWYIVWFLLLLFRNATVCFMQNCDKNEMDKKGRMKEGTKEKWHKKFHHVVVVSGKWLKRCRTNAYKSLIEK